MGSVPAYPDLWWDGPGNHGSHRGAGRWTATFGRSVLKQLFLFVKSLENFMLKDVVRNKLAFTLFVYDRFKIIWEFMRNPLILWSLYLIPIFSESELIEHRANSSRKSVFIGARGMSESDIARHVVMGRTYRLRAAPSGYWQKYFSQAVKSSVQKQG